MFIHLTRLLEKYKSLVPPGTDQIADSILLLRFGGEMFTKSHIEVLSHAIPGMKGIFWKRDFKLSVKVDETYQLTTTQLLDTSDKQLVKSIVDYSNTNVSRKFHQKFSRIRISWIDQEEIGKVVDAYKGSSRLADKAIAIIPFKDETAWQWSNVTYGLAWYALWSLSTTEFHEWVFLIDEFLLNYLKLTTHIGGIPSLPFKDIDAQVGLVFFGDFALLEQVSMKLSAVATSLSDEEFQKYYNRYEPVLDHWAIRV